MRTPAQTNSRAPVALWLPGLLVALGAGVATAHGLYETARAAGTPAAVAALYPLITDGLALVAYATTTRLAGRGRRYAWTVVVLAAGLSGLAQASYLAGGIGTTPAALRFGIGAWPALAAALVAHLLYLLATAQQHTTHQGKPNDAAADTYDVNDGRRWPLSVQPAGLNTAGHGPPDRQDETAPVQSPAGSAEHPNTEAPPDERQPNAAAPSPAKERARAAARRHAARQGDLPTVSVLAQAAEVARGTAAAALKDLRAQPAQLRAVPQDSAQESRS